MEAIIKQDRTRRLTAVCALLLLLFMCSISVVNAYDFSGGYSSSRVVGVTGGNILTIGGSSSSSLDVGMEGETPLVTSNPPSAADTILSVITIVIAFAIIVSSFRLGNPLAILLSVIIGLMAFIIVQNLLGL